MNRDKDHSMEEELAALKKEREELAKQVEALQKEKDELKAQAELRTTERDELHKMLAALQAEKDDVFGKLQRVSADYTNYQKRVPRQIADSVVYEKEKLIKSLLPIIDNFERTLQQSGTAQTVDAVLDGVRIIHDHLLDILKIHGVEPIEALGKEFDPAEHEAVIRREDPEKADHVVLEVLQNGYRMGDRVLRPARVAINRIAPKQIPSEPAV